MFSNLDRLPPHCARRANKRKSDSPKQQEPRKRARHGGPVGRPRKSERQASNSHPDAVKDTEEKDQSLSQDTAEEEVPQMVTRRTTHRSAASTLGSSTPASAGPKQRQDTVVTNDVAMKAAIVGAIDGEDTTAGHEASAPAPTTSALKQSLVAKLKVGRFPAAVEDKPKSAASTTMPESQLSDTDLLAIGLSKTSSPARRSSRKKLSTPKSAKMQPPVKSSDTPNGSGKFFILPNSTS